MIQQGTALQAHTPQSIQLLTFRLREELFAIPIRNVREVLKPSKITHIPAAPEFLKGVINVRGNVVPVVDLQIKFRMPATVLGKSSRVIIVESRVGDKDLILGALADSVDEVIDMETSQIEPPPPVGIDLDSRFIQGIGKRGEEFIILLEVGKVFSVEELMQTQHLGNLHQPGSEQS
ncbi:MAG: chemotaxis protein CheW [Magnetococcales bacterium]|nr:chemotaxis protein CheW [Magnetococcales bacterium]